MDGLSPAAIAYVTAACRELEAAGVKVDIYRDEDAPGFAGGKLGGYFDEEGPTFFVGEPLSSRRWLPVFLHEFQHFRQWQAKSPTWTATLAGDCCAWYVFEAWLAGVVEMTPQQRDDAIRMILACEIECETMTLAEVAANPGLGITSGWYTQMANAYLAYHGAVRVVRRWYQVSPYSDDEIVAGADETLQTLDRWLYPVAPPGPSNDAPASPH
jgi:hypothetical protein